MTTILSDVSGHVFITYARSDREYVDRLANVLAANGVKVWFDREIISGGRWDRVIEQQIESCAAMLVVMSPSAGASTWVLREIMTAEEYRKPIFPLLLNGSPFFQLHDLQYEDVVGERMPSRAFVERLRAEFGLGVQAATAEGPGNRISEDEHASMVALVQAAFDTAGRPTRAGLDPELLLPGPVWVSTAASPSAVDVERYRRQKHGSRQQSGYFVHAGDLQPDAAAAVDRLRLSGNPVITMSVRALRAAYSDARVPSFLHELELTSGPRDDLFNTRNALIDERFLFGRDWILSTIGGAIQRDEHVLITGLRKVGKTSLLNILRQHLVDHPVCMVDLQRYDRHTEDWPPLLFKAMVEAFDRWGSSGMGGDLPRIEWPFTASAPASATALAEALETRSEFVRKHWSFNPRLVVILDELERVFPARGEDEAARRWVRATGALRALGQGTDRSVVVIAADLRPTANRANELGAAGTNPLFNLMHEIPLKLLDSEATAEMVETVGRLMGITTVTRGFQQRLFALTGGHPSLARTLAGAAYQQRVKTSLLDEADLASGVESLEDSNQVGFFLRSNLWQLMTPTERESVRLLVGEDQPAAGAEPKRLREAFSTLRAQGLLTRDGHGIGLFAQWVADLSEDEL